MVARTLSAAALLTAALVACGGDDTESTGSTDATTAQGTVTASGDTTASTATTATDPTTVISSTPAAEPTTDPGTTTEPSVLTTNASETSTITSAPTPESTTSMTVATPSPAAEVYTFSALVPDGEFIAVVGDLVVRDADGDLVLLPNALSPGNEAPPIELLDRPDPRDARSEGTGPVVVDEVAGYVNGSLVYGDCCEPVSGNLNAVTSEGDEVLFGVGSNPELSPDGTRLATANANALTVADNDSGEGRGVPLNQDPDTPYVGVVDLEWADDTTLATLGVVDEEFELTLWDATSLTATASVRLDDLADLEQARFAGRSPDGSLAVEVIGPDLVTVRMFDVASLQEDTAARLEFPPTVSGIEMHEGELGLTWIDGEILYYLPPSTFEARPLRSGVAASWFVDGPAPTP